MLKAVPSGAGDKVLAGGFEFAHLACLTKRQLVIKGEIAEAANVNSSLATLLKAPWVQLLRLLMFTGDGAGLSSELRRKGMRLLWFGGIDMRKLFLLVVLVCTQFGLAQQSPPIPVGVDSLTQLDRLPLLRHQVWFHSVSSQDVTGGNDDGFTGAFSYLYTEDGRWVLLDTRGPGCVTLFRVIHHNRWNGTLWIRTKKGGSVTTDTLPFRDLYSGRRPPFLAPLVRDEEEAHGSSWNLVPICSEDGIKLSTDKPGLFLDIFYDLYGPNVPLVSYSPTMDVGPAIKRWQEVGQPLDRRPSKPFDQNVNLPPRTIVPVWSASEPGTITGLSLRLPKLTHEALRHVRIKAYWDDQEEASVDSPLGPFFGTGYWPVPDPPGTPQRYGRGGEVPLGRIATRSLPVGADKDGFYNFFPMPFFKSARIDLVNESGTPINDVEVTVNTVAGPPPPSSAYFHAQWHEENPTQMHRDYTVLEAHGHGHYVGAVLVMSSVNYDPGKRDKVQRGFLEGDARFYIDDNRTFTNASTGTEEYFLWGFYDAPQWDSVFSFPVSGYPFHDIDAQDNTVMYRFHLSDLVPYYRSFYFTLEHGGEAEKEKGREHEVAQPSHYSSTAFYYQRDEPVLDMTDKLAMEDGQSQQAHAYRADETVWEGCRDLPFEGDRQILFTRAYIADQKNGTRESLAESLHSCGQRSRGTVEFTASILAGNSGVKLRRLLDYAPPDIPGQELVKRPQPLIVPAESAHVFVDGKDAGEWYTAPRHARLAWLEDDFEIPAEFTMGKTKLRIRLDIAPQTAWSAFEYRLYSYRQDK
jgi:hypothetical protein